MCTSGYFLTNKYTRSRFFVKCGKCKSCLQEKAAKRSSRIRSEYDGERSVYFGTLTYDRYSCPYFKLSEFRQILRNGHILPNQSIHVYRRYSVRWSVNRNRYEYYNHRVLLNTIYISEDNEPLRGHMKLLKYLRDDVGVCYYKDWQLFAKRFRSNLQRSNKFPYEFPIKMFQCSEYGGKSQRPHFHFLLFAPSGYDKELHEVVVQSWPYGFRVREKESFQLVTDDPAGYVASYINGGSRLSSFLTKYFPPRSFYSKHFGHSRDVFQLASLEKSFQSRGDLQITIQRTTSDGQQAIDIPVPKYVVNRYFPLFKGYSRLARSSVYDYISAGCRPSDLRELASRYDGQNYVTRIDLSFSDIVNITKRFQHAYEFYRKVHSDATYVDYAIAYDRFWTAYRSTLLKMWMTDETVSDCYKYDNIGECSDRALRDILLRTPLDNLIIFDPNNFPQNVNKTIRMEAMYDKYCKQKEITGEVLNATGVYV